MSEPPVVKVTQRAVAAARLLLTLDEREGRESSEAVKAIAGAKRHNKAVGST